MSEVCGDNRFELIGEFKGKLVEGTNIESSPEEMAVLDNFLFRIWQMGWLDKLKAQEPVEPVRRRRHGQIGYSCFCGMCGYGIGRNEKYCALCGRPVKWG